MSVVVGIGVIISNHQGKILVGKRSSKHAPYWSIFGGHLEAGKPLKPVLSEKLPKKLAFRLSTLTFSAYQII